MALGVIKGAAAKANKTIGILDAKRSRAIFKASKEVWSGKHDNQFPIDIFQTGSGTSTNMNANEVIATLASKYSGTEVDSNDHVNMGQSSNDTIPTAINISVSLQIKNYLLPNLNELIKSFKQKEKDFNSILKLGRTHLQDATPLTLGQEFSGYTELLNKSKKRIIASQNNLYRLAQGGTAVGTGINTNKKFGKLPF